MGRGLWMVLGALARRGIEAMLSARAVIG